MHESTSPRAVLVRKARLLRAALRAGFIRWVDYAAAAGDVYRRLEALDSDADRSVAR